MKIETTPNGTVIAKVATTDTDAVQAVRRHLVDTGIDPDERTLAVMDGREMRVFPAAGMSKKDAAAMAGALALRLTSKIH